MANWTDKDLEIFRRMRAAGNTHAEIARALGVRLGRVTSRSRWELMSEETKAKRRERVNAYRRLKTKKFIRVPRDNMPVPGNRPTEEMLAEAAYRLSAPRSLTAIMMGDPPPGYSALERRP